MLPKDGQHSGPRAPHALEFGRPRIHRRLHKIVECDGLAAGVVQRTPGSGSHGPQLDGVGLAPLAATAATARAAAATAAGPAAAAVGAAPLVAARGFVTAALLGVVSGLVVVVVLGLLGLERSVEVAVA